MVYDLSTVKFALVVDVHKLFIGAANMVMFDESLWEINGIFITKLLGQFFPYLFAKIGIITARLKAD